MSRVGGDPFASSSTGINPIYTSKADAAQATQAATGSVGGHAVQLAPAATAPAHSSGIGDKIKSFFNAVGKGLAEAFRSGVEAFQGLFTRAPQAQAPAPQAAGAQGPAPQAAVAEPKDSVLEGLRNDPAYTRVKDAEAEGLSPAERGELSYAQVRIEADEATNGNNAAGTFLRSNNIASKTSKFIADSEPFFADQMADIKRSLKTREDGSEMRLEIVAFSKAAFGHGSDTPNHPDLASMKTANGGVLDKGAVIAHSAAVLDDFLCQILGTPGDQQSIDDAAARLPQPICDQLGVMYRAVDDSSASAEDKAALKAQCGRDALMLRGFNPKILTDNKTMNAGEMRTLVELSKAFQSVINGQGIGADDKSDLSAEAKEASADMKARWNPAFADFIDAVAARADANLVATAARDGAPTARAYQDIEAQISDRNAEMRR